MRAVIGRLERLLGGPVTLEELKHKPGRRRTLRARAGERTAIVKLYASERAGTVAARVGALSAGPEEPGVPHVLLTDASLRLVVLSDVPGIPLRHSLLAADLAACTRAGTALGGWHRAWSGERPPVLRPHTAERELEILSRRAEGTTTTLGSAVRSAARRLDGPWPRRRTPGPVRRADPAGGRRRAHRSG